ncbi:MAG TPA: trigger factor [Methylomirabilota bacterium]|nr:trigger factor [Methylomirabilota bacterium]
MPYKLTEHTNHRVEIAGSLAADVVDRERTGIVRSIRGRAHLPGFRHGRAPESMIRARFAEDIAEELREQLSKILWQEVLEAEPRLEPLTPPEVRDLGFEDDGSFRLVADLEVRPDYELPDLAEAELPDVSLEVADAEITAELERLAEEHAVWEPVEDEPAADGMLVEAELHGVMEGSDQEPYHEHDARFVLGSEGVPAEVGDALQGATVGEQRTAERSFPADDDKAERAGKTVRYTIDVKALKRKAVPEVDDELAKSLGLADLAELTERVRAALVRAKTSERRDTWRRALLDYLSRNVDLNELPPSLVHNAVHQSLNRIAYQMAMQGVTPEQAGIDWQELGAKAEPAARRRVADTLILEQLAVRWEIGVPEAEVDRFIAAEASQLGVPPAEHKANLAAEDKLDEIRHAARLTAVVDEMIRRASGEVA